MLQIKLPIELSIQFVVDHQCYLILFIYFVLTQSRYHILLRLMKLRIKKQSKNTIKYNNIKYKSNHKYLY